MNPASARAFLAEKAPDPTVLRLDRSAATAEPASSGSTNSAPRIAPTRLAEITGAVWVDVREDARQKRTIG